MIANLLRRIRARIWEYRVAADLRAASRLIDRAVETRRKADAAALSQGDQI